MKNDSYNQAREKARRTRLKKRIEMLKTPFELKQEKYYSAMSVEELMKTMKSTLDDLNKYLKICLV